MIRVIWPQGISLRYWANSLVADYYTENLPMLDNEEQWQKWAALVAGTGIFLSASVPSPIDSAGKTQFKKWDDWAKRLYIVMSNEYNN
jgi:hypothetical protein